MGAPLLEASDPRLLREPRFLVGRGPPAVAAVGVQLRVLEQLRGLLVDLPREGVRRLHHGVDRAQLADDAAPDLAHDAPLVDADAVVVLVLRPEEAAAGRVPRELGDDPACLARAGQASQRTSLEARVAPVPAQRDLP